MFESLCAPALIFMIFGIAHVILSMFKLNNMIAMKQFLMTLLFTTLLNFLCERNLSIISWILISIPFFIMAFSTIILIFTYLSNKPGNKKSCGRDIVLYHEHGDDESGKSIEEKRNYKYELDTSFNGVNEMRFIRDQRLSTY